MSTITKQAVQAVADLKAGYTLGHADVAILNELARIALASLEAEPVAWRYRYVKKGITDSHGEPWVGDWKYMPTKEDCNDRPSYEIQALYAAPPATSYTEAMLRGAQAQMRCILADLDLPENTPFVEILNAIDALKHPKHLQLPCDVKVGTSVTISKGCDVAALIESLRAKSELQTLGKFEFVIDSTGQIVEPPTRVPHDLEVEIVNLCNDYLVNDIGDDEVVQRIWNACRAAMLQSFGNSEQLDEVGSWNNHMNTPTANPAIDTGALLKHIEGMEVSVDVSTCDADAGHRYFGTVTEISELDTAKNGYILLVQDAKPNFKQAGNSPVTPDGWIPVSERMPDKLIPVMVMYADGEMWSAMWSGQFWDDGCTIPDPHAITHWREMPAAPQQEDVK